MNLEGLVVSKIFWILTANLLKRLQHYRYTLSRDNLCIQNLTLKDRKWICPNCGSEIIRDGNAGKNLRDNAINLLVDEIKSTLGWEPSEVMSMEGMEATYFNGMLSGLSCKVENTKSLA